MDQIKIGNFLKELRKSKKLTQEELAEVMRVSSKTVSRWETGFNMPDISILIELAEFYGINIMEIINGEREDVTMNKDNVVKLNDYIESINQEIRHKLFWLTIAAIIGMIAYIIIELNGLDIEGSLYEKIASTGLGLSFGMLVVLAMYLSGLLGKIKAKRRIYLNKVKNK